jgi:hypothetical protein
MGYAGASGNGAAAGTTTGAATASRALQESVAGHPASPAGTKLCCVCGIDVAGHKRYKDHTGRYWCEECKQAGREPGDGVPCPECHNPTAPDKWELYQDKRICQSCVVKKNQAAKRESSRMARAAEEARSQEQRRKLYLSIAAGVGVLVVFVALWMIFN